MAREIPRTRKAQVALLRQRIEQSGLTTRKFATTVLIRDDRTIRRWLSEESPIPKQVMEFLVDPWEVPWPKAQPASS